MNKQILPHIVQNPNDSVFTQTSYSGKLRWYYKPLYDEPTLQQEEVIHYFKNGLINNTETKWIDVPTIR